MKNIIFTLTALATISTMAVGKLNPKTVTEAEFREAFAEIMAASPSTYGTVADRTSFWSVSLSPRFTSIRLEMDTQLAATNRSAPPQYTKSWPRASAISRDRLGWSTNFPVRLALANKFNVNARYAPIIQKGASYEECIAMLNEAIKSYALSTPEEFDTLSTGIRNVAVKVVKRKLREEGKSFVEKDGVNPVAERVKSLADALNAPRFAGLNEWNKSMGIDARIDVTSLPSEQNVTALKNAIFYGEKKISRKSRLVLRLCLGVDGYNQFVKEYNGD